MIFERSAFSFSNSRFNPKNLNGKCLVFPRKDIPRMLFGLGLLIGLQLDYKSGRSISACIPGHLNCYLWLKHNPGSRATVWNIFQTGVWGYKKSFSFARNMTSWVQLLREVTSYDVIALEMWVRNLRRGTKCIYTFLKLGCETFLTAKMLVIW